MPEELNIITSDVNTVDVNTDNRTVVITNESDTTTVTLSAAQTTVVQIATIGPKGDKGDIGNIDTSTLATTGSNTFIGNQTITGSLNITNGITGSLLGTASFAATASYALNAGAGAGFPYSGSAVITGSLLVTGGISGSFTGSLKGTAETASYYVETDPKYTSEKPTLATTGSNTFSGDQIINGENIGLIIDASNLKRVGFMKYGGLEGSIARVADQNFRILRTTGSNINDGTNAITDFYIAGDGKVGIGTTTPNTVLDVSGSSNFVGNQTITGSITFDGGAQIIPTTGPRIVLNTNVTGAIDITAGTGGGAYASLTSNNTQSFVWVDNDGAYVLTSESYQWVFRNDGLLIAPGGITAPSFTGSLQGTASWASNYIESDPIYNAEKGRYLTTGSSGTTQTISGSLVINQNLTILGSQSVQYVTSSQLNISTNLITVNTATPAVRFGGLAVYDSGSLGTGLTGSLLWDSEHNVWIYTNPSGGLYDGGMLLVGPRSAGIGNEVGINRGYAAVGDGSHHMTSSQIYNSESIIRLETNTQITGRLVVSQGITGSFSGSVFGYATDETFNSLSSSFNQFTQSILSWTGSVATTGSNVFRGNQNITGSLTVSGSTIMTGSLNLSGSLLVRSGSFSGSIRFAGLDNTPQSFDLVYPTNGALRFGVQGGDGPQFQGWGGTEANFPGQMYFDYGSNTRTLANRAAYFRNMNNGSITNVMVLDSNNRVGIGTSTPTSSLHINLSNTDFTNTNGANSHILLTNPSATGQTSITSIINGAIRAKWRTDHVGNINWVAGSGGSHAFYTDGDFNVGRAQLSIANNGNILIGTTTIGGSHTDRGFKLDISGSGASGSLNVNNILLVRAGNTTITGSLTVVSGSHRMIMGSPITDTVGGFQGDLLIQGNTGGVGVARIIVGGTGLYQDLIFSRTNAAGTNMKNWSFGNRYDTFFGNNTGSFQIVGTAIDDTYRVPLIAQPNGDLILAGATTNATNGNVGIGKTTTNAKLDVSGNTVITGSLTVVTGSSVELQVTNTGVTLGNTLADLHRVTGSFGISGSLLVTQSRANDANGRNTLLSLSNVLDVAMSNTSGERGIRIYATSSLTTTPGGAAIQFFSADTVSFPGQFFIDSAAHNNAAIIFRTAQSAGTITERMRISSTGNVGIGTNSPQNNLDVVRGTAGSMNRGYYEAGSFSYDGDAKIGFYNAQDGWYAGGVSLLLGHSNIVTSNDATYPGFEFQYSGDPDEASNFVRYNYVGRNEAGQVVNYVADVFKIYSSGVVTINPNVGNASVQTTPRLGIGKSSPTEALDVSGSAYFSNSNKNSEIYIDEAPVSPAINLFNYINFT